MPILCAQVGRVGDGTVLCTAVEKAMPSFDLKQLSEVLSKAQANKRMSFDINDKHIHYSADDNIVVVVATDDSVHRKIAYSFLDDVKKQFLKMYIEPVHTLSADMCTHFREPLVELMEKHSRPDEGAQRIEEIKGTLEEVKGVMASNIDKVIERGGKIESIVERSEQFEEVADGFRRSARSARKKLWWQNVKTKLGLAVAVIVFILIVSMIFCGGPTYSGCR
eukprot:TRINITY_DN14093_c0_g1_i2.p1 TRINITY_DN14093_c0_g1~~TRINITY_DN14093_c0_g1_i2.p1  ORF type:complete len:222 (+),score=71.37 TRINITY_DN14093_c0_g1_i2:40-705(+)